MLTTNRPDKLQVLTKDIFSVSYYLANGLTISEILLDAESRRGKATFVLEGEDIARLEYAIKTGTATVQLLELKENMKRAKDLMFDFLRSKNCYEKSNEQNHNGAKENDIYQRANTRD